MPRKRVFGAPPFFQTFKGGLRTLRKYMSFGGFRLLVGLWAGGLAHLRGFGESTSKYQDVLGCPRMFKDVAARGMNLLTGASV